MEKKKKLKLEGLRVESFVTSLNDKEKKMINGGLQGGSPVWLCKLDEETRVDTCDCRTAVDCNTKPGCAGTTG